MSEWDDLLMHIIMRMHMRRNRVGKIFFAEKYSDKHHEEIVHTFLLMKPKEKYVTALACYCRNEVYFVKTLSGQLDWRYPVVMGVL